MGRGKSQNMAECPKCFHHFDRTLDIIHKLCKRCNQWRPSIDFTSGTFICKICKGIPVTRFASQVRLRTKNGSLLKQCTKCHLWKPESSYAKESAAKDNLQCWCIDCNNAYRGEKRAELETK